MTAMILGWLANHWLLIAAVVVGIAAIANPVLVWKFKAWILLAVVLWWGWTGHAAYDHLALQTKTDAALAAAQVATARAQSSEAARVEEQTRALAINSVAKAYERGKHDGQAAADALRAAVDAGTLVLRDKFRCPVAAAAGVPGATAGAGRGDGHAPAILSAADQGFLVRIGVEADDLARQLTACQAVVAADRE